MVRVGKGEGGRDWSAFPSHMVRSCVYVLLALLAPFGVSARAAKVGTHEKQKQRKKEERKREGERVREESRSRVEHSKEILQEREQEQKQTQKSRNNRCGWGVEVVGHERATSWNLT